MPDFEGPRALDLAVPANYYRDCAPAAAARALARKLRSK